MTEAEQSTRLRALLTDPNLPIEERESLQEAIMNGHLSTSPSEHETVAQRVRREAREDGRLDGIRASMLELVRQVAPERLPEFEAIEDSLALQRAALALVQR